MKGAPSAENGSLTIEPVLAYIQYGQASRLMRLLRLPCPPVRPKFLVFASPGLPSIHLIQDRSFTSVLADFAVSSVGVTGPFLSVIRTLIRY